MATNSGDAVSSPALDGEWIVPSVSYIEPQRRFCALCGRPIARRYWRTTPAGAELAFCDPDHAALYVEYGDHPATSERRFR